mgnify:CR=1 FL=1
MLAFNWYYDAIEQSSTGLAAPAELSVKSATSSRWRIKDLSLIRGRDIKKGKKMKYIVAIIQPGKVEAVYNALLEVGISGLTTSEVHGYGRQKGKTEMYRGAEYVVNFLPKMKIEVAVSSKEASKVVTAIKAASESGKIGDGKIFTLDLADAMRIRTGETGAEAL